MDESRNLGAEPIENPYAAPEAPLVGTGGAEFAEPGVAPTPEYVGFAPRAWARVLDLVYFWLLSCLAGGIAGLVGGVLLALKGLDEQAMQARFASLGAFSVSQVLIGMLASWLAASVTAGLSGSSPGKLALRLLALRAENLRPIGLWPALVREALYFVDSFFFGIVAYAAMQSSDCQQRLGDRAGGTVVVRWANAPPGSRPSVLRIVMAITAGTAVGSLVLIAWYLSRVISG